MHFTTHCALVRFKKKRLSVTHKKTRNEAESETSVSRRLHFPGYTAASAQGNYGTSRQRPLTSGNYNSQNAARPQHPERQSATFT